MRSPPPREAPAAHECLTTQQRGWREVRNGELLRLAEAEFGLFITTDQNIRYQQNLAGFKIAILELSTNNLRRIQAASDEIEKAVAGAQPGQYRIVVIPWRWHAQGLDEGDATVRALGGGTVAAARGPAVLAHQRCALPGGHLI